jgi:uncharacterized protein DUF1552
MTAIRTSSTRERLSRRAFLRRVGASAALLPLLDAGIARGAPGAFPKRLVTIAWSNGVAQPSFYPPADDPTAGAIMQPLASLKAKVTMVAGLDYMTMLPGHAYDGHFSFPTMFTGTYKNLGGQNSTAAGPSIDQVVSTAVATSVNLPVPLLTIAAQGNSTSYRADGTQNTAETQVARLYSTLFASQAMPSSQVSALTARHKSVLDYIVPELSSFATNRGTDDQAKIAAHLDSIRQLETSLTATTSASCMPVDPGAPTEYQASVKAFSDMVVMAISCDVTRSVALTWAADGGSAPYTMPFLNLGNPNSMGIGQVHAIAHQGTSGYPQKLLIDTWYMQQLAYLASAMDATAEGSGTMLDNSLIVMGNDMSEGSQHLVGSIPFVLVGSAGGALKTGRTVAVGSWATQTGNYWTSKTGIPHNQLLATVSNLMDVPATSFGTGYPGTLSALA